jgi:hypothetical protein
LSAGGQRPTGDRVDHNHSLLLGRSGAHRRNAAEKQTNDRAKA